MNTRELLWAVTYGWNRWAFRGNERRRQIALDEALQSVADFDEFFAEGPPVELHGGPKPVDPPASIGAWEITDPDTWEVEPFALEWRSPEVMPPGWPSQVPQIIARAVYVKTLRDNRELWATSLRDDGWRLVVAPREDQASVVVWIGQGATPERFL